MKLTQWILTCALVAACPIISQAQAKPAAPRTVSEIMDHAVSQVEGEFLPAADAMPEAKYSFAPTNGDFKGVRTFAQQVRHVAAVNYMIGATILEQKPPVDVERRKWTGFHRHESRHHEVRKRIFRLPPQSASQHQRKESKLIKYRTHSAKAR